jgi:hypothetical protein
MLATTDFQVACVTEEIQATTNIAKDQIRIRWDELAMNSLH